MNLQTNRFRAGQAFERQSRIDWLLTGNNQGPLILTTNPTDTHHCAEPSGFTPKRFFICKIGAQGGTRTHKIWLLRPTRIPIPSPGLI